MPPGWLDDPEDSQALRYWDGHSWTDRRAPKTRGYADTAPREGADFRRLATFLLLIGALMAVVFLAIASVKSSEEVSCKSVEDYVSGLVNEKPDYSDCEPVPTVLWITAAVGGGIFFVGLAIRVAVPKPTRPT